MEFEAGAPSRMSLGDLRPGSISFTKAIDPLSPDDENGNH